MPAKQLQYNEHYCHNVLVVEGDNAEIQALAKQLFPYDYHQFNLVPQSAVFDFNRVLSIPKEINVDESDEMTSWRIQHWGTRSNASNALVTLADNVLLIYFTTHWSPPIGVYQWIKESPHNLVITIWYQNIDSVA